jgi:hypothetical protein
VSLLGWIKSAIGLDKAPARASDPTPRTLPKAEVPSPPEVDIAQIEIVQIDNVQIAAAQVDNAPVPVERPAHDQELTAIEVVVEAISVEPAPAINIEVKSAIPPPVEIGAEPAPPIALEPEEPPTPQEIDRRRALVRSFFNDYWSSIDDKPASFAERLDHAENYINERAAAGGEAWRLCPATRKQLGLPVSRNRGIN